MSVFEELGICPEIIQAIEDDNWLLPTPIQGECIPNILGGRDVCAAAETGSGKTGAFGLPCLQIVHETLRNKATTKGGSSGARAEKSGPRVGPDLNDKDPFVVASSDGSEIKCEDTTRWSGIRCMADVVGGKYQWEILLKNAGICRVGVSTGIANLDLGKDVRGWGFGGTGKKAWNNKFETYGEPFGEGDVIGVLLDRSNRTLSFCKNGRDLGIAYRFSEAHDTVPLKPHICGKGFHVQLMTKDLRYPVADFKQLSDMQDDHSTALMTAGLEHAGRSERHPLCLVLEPTRDLAVQTYECFVHFAKYLDAPSLRITLCVGGIDDRKQKQELQAGVDIVVGTLPKISQWESRHELSLANLRFLVLDEADDLIKNDERNIIPRLKNAASRNTGSRVQTLFFSATLHAPEVISSINKLTSDAVWCDLKGKPTVPDTVHAVIYHVDPTKDLPIPRSQTGILPRHDEVHLRDTNPKPPDQLSLAIKMYKPQIAVHIADTLKMESCMIFCRSNVDCDNFEKYLVALGGNRAFQGKTEGGVQSNYSCVVLAGMREQAERQKNLQHFKDGDVRFLICTDVAARGIDIKELPFLIMMTLPDDADQWFHRVGRVGRADRMGFALCLVATEKEKVWYHKCSNRGRGCTNTRLIDQGGCCIWYDEPHYLKAIEAKLDSPLPRMDPSTLSIPGILDSSVGLKEMTLEQKEENVGRRAKRLAVAAKEAAVRTPTSISALYGKERDDKRSKESLSRFQQILPAAHQLAELETSLQITFLSA